MNTTAKNVIFATAGHIDHGKTGLIKAITGVDTDRWDEEKRRGITIDLGYASMAAGDVAVHFIDVPGHEKFVKNMLAGAGTVGAVLFVIAADELIKPQTIEHYEICRLLAIDKGIIALTKVDLLEENQIDKAIEEVTDYFKKKPLDGAPIIPVSARSGRGINQLKETIIKIAAETEEFQTGETVRLPIDRSFTVKGYGTVVTGSLVRGVVKKGDVLESLPTGKEFIVRNIQVFNEERDMASAGERTALNLQKASKSDLKRGDVLTNSGAFAAADRAEVQVEFLDDFRKVTGKDGRVRLHLHTTEVISRIKIINGKNLKKGEKGFARIYLTEPLFLLPGDRFVLRSISPVNTIGGGIVIHNRFTGISSENLAKDIRNLFNSEGEFLLSYINKYKLNGLSIKQMRMITGFETEAIERILRDLAQKRLVLRIDSNDKYITVRSFKKVEGLIYNILKEYHSTNPDKAGLTAEEMLHFFPEKTDAAVLNAVLKSMLDSGRVVLNNSYYSLPDFKRRFTAKESSLLEDVEDFILRSGLKSPGPGEISRQVDSDEGAVKKMLRLLCESGTLKKISPDYYLHKDTYENIKQKLEAFSEDKEKIKISEFKELFSITRKHAIPLLEYLDEIGLTRRLKNGERIINIKN